MCKVQVLYSFTEHYSLYYYTMGDLHWEVQIFRLLVSGDSVVLIFAAKGTFKSCRHLLVPKEAGVILSSEGVAPLFQTGGQNLFKFPSVVVLASSDR